MNTVDLAGSSPIADTGLTTLPVAPVATVSTQAGQVQLSWPAVNGSVAYNVYRGLAAGDEGTTPYATVEHANQFTDAGVTAGLAYYYVVTAVDFSGQSAPSSEIAAVVPAVAISGPSNIYAAGGPVTYTVTYLDPFFAASTLAPGSVTLGTTGTASGVVSVGTATVTAAGATQIVTISNITGNGTLGISIAAGTASDTLGNLAPAAGPSATFTVDNTLASIAVSPSLETLSAGASEQFTAVADNQYGIALSPQPALTWTVVGGGSINSGTGLYTPPYADGSATVQAASGAISGSASVAYSGEAEWNAATAGSWGGSANWVDATSNLSIAPPGLRGVPGDTVLFSSATGTSVTLDGVSPSVAAITLNNSAGYTIAQGTGGALELANGANAALVNVSSGDQTISAPLDLDSNTLITPAAGSSLTISGPISGGSASLTIGGQGVVALSGTNSYGGGTVVTTGTLIESDAASIPQGTSLVIGAGGVFEFLGDSTAGSAATASSASAPGSAAPASTPASVIGVKPAARQVSTVMAAAHLAARIGVSTPVGGQAPTVAHGAYDAVLRSPSIARVADAAVWAALQDFSGQQQSRDAAVATMSIDEVFARFGLSEIR